MKHQSLFTLVYAGVLLTFLLVGCSKKEDNGHRSLILSDWAMYDNDLTGFRISFPIEWGVVESSRKNRVTFIGPGIQAVVNGGLNTHDGYSPLTLDQAFTQLSSDLGGVEPTKKRNAGLARAIEAEYKQSDGQITRLLVSVYGDCVYYVRVTLPPGSAEELKEAISRFFASFEITRQTSASDVIAGLQKRALPWEVDTLAKQAYERAYTLAISGQVAEAEREYLKCISINPQKIQPRIMLGLLYHFENRSHECIAQGRAAVWLDEENPDAHYIVAIGYHSRSQIKLAEREYLRAIDLGKAKTSYFRDGAFYGIAKLYGEQMRKKDSAFYARRCLSLNPSFSEAHYILALSVIDTDPAEAGEHLLEYLHLTEGNQGEESRRADARKLLNRIRKLLSGRQPMS